MHRIALALVALLIGACTAGSPATALKPSQADSLIQAHAKDANFHLVDVRTPQEFAMGHLAGAKLVDFHGPDFEAEIGKLPRNAPILLYCRSGNRSGKAMSMMRDMGFTDVRHLDGGINNWQAEARPMTR